TYVAMGELVHQNQFWPPCYGPVEIEFLEPIGLVFEFFGREYREPFEHGRRLAPAVGLDDARYDVVSFLLELTARREHRIGLAYAGRCPEVDAQLSASGLELLLLEL